MAVRRLNAHLKPLRQGDLDGLCAVYAVLNALNWLLPKARNDDYLTDLFGRIIGPVFGIECIRDGGEEPELKRIYQFVRDDVSIEFNSNFKLFKIPVDEKIHTTPDMAIEAAFEKFGRGVVVLGFEGRDSHWTVATRVTAKEVILFDSWEYKFFSRDNFVWGPHGKSAAKSDKPVKSEKIIVAARDLNWVTIEPL